MTAIYGEADNGTRARIEVGGYAGPAGIRRREDGREVAFVGALPASTTFPLDVSIDGDAVKATAKLAQRVAGFTVLWIPD